MGLIRLAKETDFVFQSAGYNDDLRVHRFKGTEGISELYRFKIELAALDSAIDFNSLVGKPGLLTIYSGETERFINGRVLKFKQGHEATEYTYYEAHLVPLVWFLKYRHDCRIFQNMTVVQIVSKVLNDAGVPADAYRFALQKSYESREYCVQYRESDFHFISRLLEEEGLFYFFEHSRENHVMVIGDGPVANIPIAGSSTVLFREYSGMVEREEFVNLWSSGQKVCTGSVTLQDFNFKQPQMDLESNEFAPVDTSLEFYEYPGRYENQGRGKGLAKTRLEAIQAYRRYGEGQSVCRRLTSGYRFTLSQHPRNDFNREYLLVSVSHQGNQPQVAGHEAGSQRDDEPIYVNRFTCIPSDQPFRPLLKTPKPVMGGAQTAIVVGPGGEEIYTDEHGRVKVQFHWDRDGRMDENSSCWVRVSQGWAGGQYGSVYLPRIGQEVIIDFLEGDPDRPIITGRVYNGDLRTPYPLPDEKTKSTLKSNSSKGGDGYNEIRFEDMAGQEQIFTHAQKDMDIRVENDRREWIGNDRNLIVKNDKNTLVENNAGATVYADETRLIGGNKSLTVKGDRKAQVLGDSSLINIGHSSNVHVGGRSTSVLAMDTTTVVGSRSVTVLGSDAKMVAGAYSFSVIGNMSQNFPNLKQTAGNEINLVAGNKVVIEAGTELTIKVPGSAGGFIKIDKTGVTIDGAMVRIKSGGSAGKAVAAQDVILPPILPKMPMLAGLPTQPDEADDGASGNDITQHRSPDAPAGIVYESHPFAQPQWPTSESLTAGARQLNAQSGALREAARKGTPFCAVCQKEGCRDEQ